LQGKKRAAAIDRSQRLSRSRPENSPSNIQNKTKQNKTGADLLRIVGILLVGMVATLLFTAQTTVWIREAVKTPVKEVAKGKPSAPFTKTHYFSWSLIGALSLAATVADPSGLGANMALPFGLAATVGGYLLGEQVPKSAQGVLHPVVVTALVANGGVALQGALRGLSYAASQSAYLNKGAQPLMGAGDALMSLLGVVIVSFGFRIYTQRDTARRHAPEIFGATALSSLFSLFSTAFAAKAVGLSTVLAKALIPRSVTVALALPIAQSLEAPLAITAAAVLLQGILGANFGPGLMSAVGIKDTIARGLAAAGTAGGLGTASLTSKEPEALPFCALSYAMVGIFSTCVTAVPAVRDALVAIVS
jgi:putative effector of murein hydrolase